MSNDSDLTGVQGTEASLPYDFYENSVQQSKRDEASRLEYRAPKERLEAISYPETCERCGKDLRRVYVWNGRRLCKSCMEDGQQAWTLFTGGPDAASPRVSIRPLKKAKERSLIDSLISEFLALFGLKWIEKGDGIEAPDVPRKRTRLPSAQRPDKKQMPEAEGLMNRKKRN